MLSHILFTVALAVYAVGAPIEKRASSTENELTNGACREVTFIMARGSTEIGNMVRDIHHACCVIRLLTLSRGVLLVHRHAKGSKTRMY